MIYLKSTDSIDKVGLSVRSYNVLRRNGVHTVADLLEVDCSKFNKIKGVGEYTTEEIALKINEIIVDGQLRTIDKDSDIVDLIEDIPVFCDSSGTLKYDIPLSQLGLNKNKYISLISAGYYYISQLIFDTHAHINEVTKIKSNAITKILLSASNFELLEVKISDSDRLEAEIECHKFILTISKIATINVREAYITLLPYFKEAEAKNQQVDVESLYRIPIIKEAISNKILSVLENSTFGESKKVILDYFSNTISEKVIDEITIELSNTDKLIIGENLEFKRLTLQEYVKSTCNPRNSVIVELRLKGLTLQEIGNLNGNITKERVRQIVIKYLLLKKKVKIMEDRYKEAFSNYAFTKEEFVSIFGIDDTVYRYLKLVYSRENSYTVEQFIVDESIPLNFRNRARDIISHP